MWRNNNSDSLVAAEALLLNLSANFKILGAKFSYFGFKFKNLDVVISNNCSACSKFIE